MSWRKRKARLAPGTLPDLRGFQPQKDAETNGHHPVVGLAYEGVCTAELELVSNAAASSLDAGIRYVALGGPTIAGVEPARRVEVEPLTSATALSVLVIPGGLGWQTVVDSTAVMEWLAVTLPTASGVVAVSTGSLLLAATGMLAGDRATGHWLAQADLSAMGAAATSDRVATTHDSRWVTASGAKAGVDAATALAQRILWGS